MPLARRRFVPLLVAGFVALSAPAPAQDGDGASVWPADAASAGIAALMARHSLVILGEIHGTAEVPALVAAVLAERVAGGRPVTLAVEIPDSHQAALDAWLDDPQGGDAGAALAGHRFWSFEDGRSSVAMLGLLEQVRRWRQSGAQLDLLAFDVPDPGVTGNVRERHMADRLRRAVTRPGAAPMLVLTGNLHARRKIGSPFDPGVELMAWHLRDLPALSLDVRARGGSAWICAPGCGAHELGAPDPTLAVGLRRFDRASANGYDGEVVLERFTASPPAFPSPRAGPEPGGP